MKKLRTTGKIIQRYDNKHLIVFLTSGERCTVRQNGSKRRAYKAGEVIDVYYDEQLIEHPCRCFLCHGAGCYLCQYTGKGAVYSERKINLTTHIK